MKFPHFLASPHVCPGVCPPNRSGRRYYIAKIMPELLYAFQIPLCMPPPLLVVRNCSRSCGAPHGGSWQRILGPCGLFWGTGGRFSLSKVVLFAR